ncbi:MAG: alkaline phosphatase D [Verrucomicrobiales bacterium]|jgi:alkaline phosphatase D
MINRQTRTLVIAFGALIASSCWAEEPITRIAFGSCIHQNKGQEIWPAITAQNPQLFLFMGDNIYGDTKDMDDLRAKWGQLLAQPGYQALKAKCPILATWDDHDYGWNDAGAGYEMRVPSQEIFLEAMDVPKDREPWSHPGIYDVYEYGEAGKRLQVIMLDTRYFRGPLVKLKGGSKEGPYDVNPDESATMLGGQQWTWLKNQLMKPADVRIIVSSIQALPVDHRWERWENLPRERERLFKLLGETKAGPVLILSGDRHMAEIMEMPLNDPLSPGTPVYEVTSSGMNHAHGGQPDEANRYRIGESFRELNFGCLAIDWNGAKPAITVEIKDVTGKTVRSRRW